VGLSGLGLTGLRVGGFFEVMADRFEKTVCKWCGYPHLRVCIWRQASSLYLGVRFAYANNPPFAIGLRRMGHPAVCLRE